MKYIFVLLLISFTLYANDKYLPYGIPTGTSASNIPIDNDCYMLSANIKTKFADWVAYKLTKSMVEGNKKVYRRWKRDPSLNDEYTLNPKDYKDAYKELDTDRGHQAPLASFKGTECWAKTNYLSNITPQHKNLNRYSWKKLEAKIRSFVSNHNGNVYVITGPLYEETFGKLPGTVKEHKIPSGYWKVILFKTDNKIETAAFIFSQKTDKKDSVLNHATTIDEIENRTKLDLFPNLEDNEEQIIESKKNLDWIQSQLLK